MEIATPKKCPYCGTIIDTPVMRSVIDRAWDNVRRKQFVRERKMIFCSESCGSRYQMGCEG